MPSPIRLPRLACAASIVLGCGAAAWAQGELVPIERGECEVEVGASRSRDGGQSARFEQSLRAACGVAGGGELALEAARERGGGDSRATALALEGKAALAGLQRRWPAAAWVLAGGLSWQRGGGHGWRGSEAFVQVESGRPLGSAWWVEAGLGMARDLAAHRQRTVWTATMERELGELAAFAWELDGDDREPASAGLVLRRDLDDDIEAELAWRTRLASPRERAVELRLKFGLR